MVNKGMYGSEGENKEGVFNNVTSTVGTATV